MFPYALAINPLQNQSQLKKPSHLAVYPMVGLDKNYLQVRDFQDTLLLNYTTNEAEALCYSLNFHLSRGGTDWIALFRMRAEAKAAMVALQPQPRIETVLS